MTKHNLGGHLPWLLSRGTSFVSTFEPTTRPREDHLIPIDDDPHALNALVEDDLAEDIDIISLHDASDEPQTTRAEILKDGDARRSNPPMAQLNLDPQATRSPKVPPTLKKSFSDLPVPGTPRRTISEKPSSFENKPRTPSRPKLEGSLSFQERPGTPRLPRYGGSASFQDKSETPRRLKYEGFSSFQEKPKSRLLSECSFDSFHCFIVLRPIC